MKKFKKKGANLLVNTMMKKVNSNGMPKAAVRTRKEPKTVIVIWIKLRESSQARERLIQTVTTICGVIMSKINLHLDTQLSQRKTCRLERDLH